MRRRLAGPAVAVSLALTTSGCAIPSWVPLVGKPKQAKTAAAAAPAEPAPAPAAPATSAPFAAPKPAAAPSSDDVMDRVICVVNNDAITLYELEEAEAHYLYETKEQMPTGDARKALRERLLGTIIENRIQLQQAERDKIVVDDVEITEQLQDIVKKVNARSQMEFEEALKAQGLTLDAVRKRIKDQIMVQRLTRRKVALRVSITEQEIDRYLEENRSKLEVGLGFEARHILFLPESGKGEEGWKGAQQKAEQVYARLREGEDFGALAKEYSEDPSGKDGGNLGALKRGELAPEIEAAILKLNPGQYSAPFRSAVGYHLFKLESKETLTGDAYAQTRNQIGRAHV